MKLEELKTFMKKHNIEYFKVKEMPNGTMIIPKECPFCDGKHKTGSYIIHYDQTGYVLARCHHKSCAGKDFAYLYKKLTGKDLTSPKKKDKESEDDIFGLMDEMIDEGSLEIALDTFGNTIVKIKSLDGNGMNTLNPTDDRFKIHIQGLVLEKLDRFFDKDTYEQILTYIEVIALKNNRRIHTYKRAYYDGEKYLYELNASTNEVIYIYKDEISLETNNDICFYHSQTYVNQVIPDFDAMDNYKKLPKMVRKHFNFASNDDAILFTICLVSSFLGTAINHPLISISGQKGSGKSSNIRKFCSLVDPRNIELGSIPRNRDDLSLKISENLVNDFDNMSFLGKEVSDILCRAVTGGTDTRRTLYKDKQQTIFNLKSIVVIDGVQVVIREDDLLDRTIFFTLTRFKPEELKTEEELWQEFEKDKPIILGYIFMTLAVAMNDDTEYDRTHTLRMADFYQWAIRIGRALDYKESKIISVLEKNKREANYETLMNDTTAQAVLNYMEYKEEASHTVTEFYGVLLPIIRELHLDVSKFPKQPNTLSRKLNSIQSNLEEEGITFNIKSNGKARIITLKNANPKRVPIKIPLEEPSIASR